MSYQFEFKETILEVADVSFAYESDYILNGVTFTIRNVVRPNHSMPQGQIVTLLGKSGVGKSTLLKIIAGQLTPKTGTVRMLVHQNDTELSPAREGNVGIVYQDYLFFEHLTVKKLLYMGAKLGGMEASRIDDEVKRIIQEFGMEEHQNKWRMELSGGQKQRVAIAQQLLLGRQILILDEPFSGLDHAAKMKVASFIQKVATLHEFKTILIITHDIESAVMISDSVYLLSKNADGNGAGINAAYNLMEEGIAWRTDNHLQQNFQKVVQEIKNRFITGT